MAYAAVKGGQEAIAEAEKLLHYYRVKGGSLPLSVQQIRDQMRLAVDKVMGEGSLYDPNLAALALKQTEGDTLEASFMIRAFRSTLERNHYSLPVNTGHMRVMRRISAAFKEVPGGQYLGPTRDYTKRLLDFTLEEESKEQIREFVARHLFETMERMNQEKKGKEENLLPDFPKVIDLLRREGLLEEPTQVQECSQDASGNLDDITRHSLQFPVSRAMRLQSLARGETGAMMALAYSSNRGYGNIHPTLGELRVGYVPVCIPHPYYPGETLTLGEVLVTEAEILARMEERKEKRRAKFTLGYGFCFGHNELKAIAMGTLDRAMVAENSQAPVEDEEFVLSHIDGIEASGFVAHWKLPHYVDFQAELNRVRSIQEREGKNEPL